MKRFAHVTRGRRQEAAARLILVSWDSSSQQRLENDLTKRKHQPIHQHLQNTNILDKPNVDQCYTQLFARQSSTTLMQPTEWSGPLGVAPLHQGLDSSSAKEHQRFQDSRAEGWCQPGWD